MNIRKLYKKIKKLEKKNPNFSIIAINKHEIVSTDRGSMYMRDNLVKIPEIYNLCKDNKELNFLAKRILDIIGE